MSSDLNAYKSTVRVKLIHSTKNVLSIIKKWDNEEKDKKRDKKAIVALLLPVSPSYKKYTACEMVISRYVFAGTVMAERPLSAGKGSQPEAYLYILI